MHTKNYILNSEILSDTVHIFVLIIKLINKVALKQHKFQNMPVFKFAYD